MNFQTNSLLYCMLFRTGTNDINADIEILVRTTFSSDYRCRARVFGVQIFSIERVPIYGITRNHRRINMIQQRYIIITFTAREGINSPRSQTCRPTLAQSLSDIT